MAQVPALLTASEVARLAAVDPATVRRWADTGRLPAIKLPGGRLRFRASDVEAMLTPAGPADQAEATA